MTVQSDDLPGEVQQLLEQIDASLKPLAPVEGVERFLRSQQSEVADSTLRHHRRKLDYVCEYCELKGIENLNDLDGREVDGYQTWR